MKGSVVQVLLRTPLFRGRYGSERERPLDRTVVEVVGEVIEERSTGLHLRVTGLVDDKGNPVADLPFAEIVLPASKIDHLVLVEGGKRG